MIDVRTIGVAPAQLRFALGYACLCAWAVVLLLSPAFGLPGAVHAAAASMLPGLVAYLASIVGSRRLPSVVGRTPFVTASALFMAAGTFVCTFPATAGFPAMRIAGLAFSGFFAIILIMSWFDAYARMGSRAIIVLAGCAASVAALLCWAILACPARAASGLATLLPLVSLAVLPRTRKGTDDATNGRRAIEHVACAPAERTAPGLLDIMAAAVPLRTLVGLAITFFIVSSIGSLAPEFGLFSTVVSPVSLLIPLGVTAFFVASAFFLRGRIDPSALYKVLLSAFAAGVFLLMLSIGISAALVFYANIVAEALTWMVLALWAKKTPVEAHLVFAIGWIAECVGNTLGQSLAPLFATHIEAFYVVSIMLILIAVGFAFSEGRVVLEIDFEENGGEEGPQLGSTEQGRAHARPKGSLGANAEESRGASVSRTAPNGASVDDADAVAEKADPIAAFASAHDLSPREREVAALWLTGHGLKYIENALFISEATVKTHLRNIYRKCDTHNRAEIIALFEQENGLV